MTSNEKHNDKKWGSYREGPFDEVYEAIKDDKSFQNLHHKVQGILHYIKSWLEINDNFTDDDIKSNVLETQCKILTEWIQSDLRKLERHGFITISSVKNDSSNSYYHIYCIGSEKIRNLMKTREWKERYKEIIRTEYNYEKIDLNTLLYSKKHFGKSVDEVLRVDSDYIITGLDRGYYIMSEWTLELIEKQYTIKIQESLKQKLAHRIKLFEQRKQDYK